MCISLYLCDAFSCLSDLLPQPGSQAEVRYGRRCRTAIGDAGGTRRPHGFAGCSVAKCSIVDRHLEPAQSLRHLTKGKCYPEAPPGMMNNPMHVRRASKQGLQPSRMLLHVGAHAPYPCSSHFRTCRRASSRIQTAAAKAAEQVLTLLVQILKEGERRALGSHQTWVMQNPTGHG